MCQTEESIGRGHITEDRQIVLVAQQRGLLSITISITSARGPGTPGDESQPTQNNLGTT
jgi:hypothetical protein